MNKFTFGLLILSAIVGLSMCDEEVQNKAVKIDQIFSKNMDNFISSFNAIETYNEESEKQLIDILEDESAESLAVTAVKFLELMNLKQVAANAQLEDLEEFQKLASEFISQHSN